MSQEIDSWGHFSENIVKQIQWVQNIDWKTTHSKYSKNNSALYSMRVHYFGNGRLYYKYSVIGWMQTWNFMLDGAWAEKLISAVQIINQKQLG